MVSETENNESTHRAIGRMVSDTDDRSAIERYPPDRDHTTPLKQIFSVVVGGAIGGPGRTGEFHARRSRLVHRLGFRRLRFGKAFGDDSGGDRGSSAARCPTRMWRSLSGFRTERPHRPTAQQPSLRPPVGIHPSSGGQATTPEGSTAAVSHATIYRSASTYASENAVDDVELQ